MPRPFSEDLRWRAIWIREILGYEVAAVLQMCPRTIKRYVSKVLNYGTVKANTIGRPINSVAMHPHVAFLIFEAVLEHPEKTLSEVAHDVYSQTGSELALASIFYYLRRNRFSRKKVCLYLSACELVFTTYETFI